MLKKKISNIICVISFFALIIVNPSPKKAVGASQRSTFDLDSIADTYISSMLPDNNYGGSTELRLLYTGIGWENISLIKFDIGSLPEDAVVVSATMHLYLQSATWCETDVVEVYPITSAWDESTITWNTALGLTTSPIGISKVVDNVTGEYKDFALIPSFVQNWIDNPSSNHGLMLHNQEDDPIYAMDCDRIFLSRELVDYEPYLEVTYYQDSIYSELSGRVYQGDVGDESTPIEGVNLILYCSYSSGNLGTIIDTTITDSTGWYKLNGYYGCDYYSIVEIDPTGYISSGATTVSGFVISSSRIQYLAPLSGQTLTGNKFWDQPGSNSYLPLIKN